MKTKLLAVLMALIVLVSAIPLSAGALTASMFVYTSNGKSLNMRVYPSMDADIVTTIPYGAAVDVMSGWNDTWAHCDYNGITGYCMTRYLTTSEPGPKPTKTATPAASGNLYSGFASCYYTATVRPSSPGGFVHMRWAPSKKQPIHADYYAGAPLTVVADNGTWCQVIDESSNTCGFMMKSFLVADY